RGAETDVRDIVGCRLGNRPGAEITAGTGTTVALPARCVISIPNMAMTTDSLPTRASVDGDVRQPSRFPYRTVALGVAGSILLMLAALGAGGILIDDPVLGHSPLS